jgi:hypothetical protein
MERAPWVHVPYTQRYTQPGFDAWTSGAADGEHSPARAELEFAGPQASSSFSIGELDWKRRTRRLTWRARSGRRPGCV